MKCDLCGKQPRQPASKKDGRKRVYYRWFRHHVITKHPEVKMPPPFRKETVQS